MNPFRPVLVLVLALSAPLGAARGQMVFGWPIRTNPQPEAVLTGAGAVFWNPGSLAAGMGTPRELWITHVDGPDVTGVRGVAAAVALDLPRGLRAGFGYWHLGIPDIPRTTTSPTHEAGEIQVTEDVAVLSLAGEGGFAEGRRVPLGLGASLRLQRGSVEREVLSRVEGEMGIHLRPRLPLSPRLGVSLQGLGGEMSLVGGVEATLATLATGRLPVLVGYGLQTLQGPGSTEQRLSLRGSWLGQLHGGVGLARVEGGDGWNPLWMLGFDVGRYSLAVLREGLANGFGPIHFYRAAIRFP